MGVGLRFEVLGPVRAWRGDAEVDLGSPQQRAILAILLLRNGSPASPDQLISAIWGLDAPRAAVGMVRSYVSRLRRALDAETIGSVAGGYVLAPTALDLTEFTQRIAAGRAARQSGDAAGAASVLRAALALWRGDPLAGVRGDYAEHERTRLEELRLAALEDLAAADLDAGRHTGAAADLAALVAEQPLRERPRELLMLALYRSGRQAEALTVFTEFRRLLADELGIDPGPDLRDMHRRILTADPALLGGAEAVPATPAQLPPDLPDFVGRADVTGELAGAARPTGDGVPVVGITGLAGVGKTALAVHVGHRVAADFPDGQLFVDLGDADPATALAGLLRGIGETVPESPGERTALWRTRTAGRRLLVVLDDARDAEQVRALLPGPGGTAVVLTSRRRLFGLAVARWHKLDGLAEAESVALLERLIGTDRVRAELAELRGFAARAAGLPQVLHALGTRLASRPGWTIAVAARRMGPHPGMSPQAPECTAIEGPFVSVLHDLSPAQARALRLVALSDGPDVSLPGAAAMLDLSVTEAEVLLESLADLHLIEPESVDRYRYPWPVRVFARGRAVVEDGPAECEAALRRLLRYQESARSRASATRSTALRDGSRAALL